MILKINLLMTCLLCAFFVMAPARGARSFIESKRSVEPDKIKFAVIGDTGTGERNQFGVAQSMDKAYQQEPFGFVLMLGDNIYGSVNSRAFRERFEQPYRNLIMHGVKFQAVLGNHDKGGLEKETGYEQFNMIGKRFYTFTRGSGTKSEPLAQFFALDSSRMDEDQLAWLEKELAASQATWKIPFFHHPIYSSGRKHGSDLKLRRALEPLFTRYGVRVALSGHDHIYERINPQEGVIYFVSGSGGQLRKGDIKRDDPLFAAGNDEVCHFMLFDIEEDEARFRAIDINGAVIDQGVISAKPYVNGQ
jgi:hypothetical protein